MKRVVLLLCAALCSVGVLCANALAQDPAYLELSVTGGKCRTHSKLMKKALELAVEWDLEHNWPAFGYTDCNVKADFKSGPVFLWRLSVSELTPSFMTSTNPLEKTMPTTNLPEAHSCLQKYKVTVRTKCKKPTADGQFEIVQGEKVTEDVEIRGIIMK